MSEETKDLNTNQSVADSGLKEQPATAQDLTNQSVTDEQAKTLADGTASDKPVSYDEFKKANDAKNAAEEQTRLLQGQMQILQANQQPVQQVQPKTTLDQAMVELGVTADELYGESMINVMNRKAELDTLQSHQNNSHYANQQFESTHQDFTSVVGLRNPVTGVVQPSAEILKILTEKPYLTTTAHASSQGAYEIVMQERELAKLKEQNNVNQEHLKQQGIDNKTSVVSGAAAGGGAISNKTTGAITVEQQLENERLVELGQLN